MVLQRNKSASEIEIRLASLGDLDSIAELFDLYRQFYGKFADLQGAQSFIRERLKARDSAIFVAELAQEIVGFVQLYPSFTSLGMVRIWILNDLFVAEEFRRHGIGEKLMLVAHQHARATEASAVILETQIENRQARALYEKLGYQVEKGFLVYSLNVR